MRYGNTGITWDNGRTVAEVPVQAHRSRSAGGGKKAYWVAIEWTGRPIAGERCLWIRSSFYTLIANRD